MADNTYPRGVNSLINAYTNQNSSILGGALMGSSSSLAPGGSWWRKRQEQYVLMEAAANGSIFKDNRKWQRYLEERDLHEKTICIINPTGRICDFYASHLYPGYLSPTGYPDAANVPLAIPIVNADDNVKNAIAQLWTWGNWQNAMIVWIRTCAALGDGPIEIVDNVTEGKVYAMPVRPEFITDIRVNDVGDVKYYVKQLQVWDDDDEEYYQYTREVSLKTINTYKNGELFGYNGNPASYPNPYGFVPLVWCKHRDPGVGIFPGHPAVRDWGKIEELNSDITWVRAFIRKQALTPQILTGMGEITPYITEEDGSIFDIENMLLMTSSEDGHVQKIEGNLSIGDALKTIDLARAELQEDHPELKAHSDFTKMSQATGPATQNILGNITNLVSLVSKTYDKATEDVHRMMVSIAGHRANEQKGGWAQLTQEQRKFLPYSLKSMTNGQLEFAIAPREVSVMSEYDLAETDRQKYIAMAAAARAGMPFSWYLKQKGYKPEQIQEILDEQEKQFDKELERAAKLQTASLGVAATLMPQIGKDAMLSNVAIIGSKTSAPSSATTPPKQPQKPGSQTTSTNSIAKSITSQQTN